MAVKPDSGSAKRKQARGDAHPPSWCRRRADGALRLEVTIQARADRDEAAGIHGGRLRLRIAAPPLDGRANRHLQGWLAKQFHVAKSRVHILRGERGRHKSVLIEAPGDPPAWFTALPTG